MQICVFIYLSVTCDMGGFTFTIITTKVKVNCIMHHVTAQ